MRCTDKGVPNILEFMPEHGVMLGKITECIKKSIECVLELVVNENVRRERARSDYLSWDSTVKQFEDRKPSKPAAKFTRNCFEEIFPKHERPKSPKRGYLKQPSKKTEVSDEDSDLASDDGDDPLSSMRAKAANYNSDAPDVEMQGLTDEDAEDFDALNIVDDRNGGKQMATNPFQIEMEEDEPMGRKWTVQWVETRPPKKQKTNPKGKNVSPFLALIAERRKQKKIDQFQAFKQQIHNVEACEAGVWSEDQIKQMRMTLKWVQQHRKTYLAAKEIQQAIQGIINYSLQNEASNSHEKWQYVAECTRARIVA